MEMRKIFEENKGKLLLSSLIIFLPFLFSVAAGKGIFYQSFFLLLIHWLCLLITLKDRKNSGQSRKALGMVFWLVPMLAMLRGALFFLMRDFRAIIWWVVYLAINILIWYPFFKVYEKTKLAEEQAMAAENH